MSCAQSSPSMTRCWRLAALGLLVGLSAPGRNVGGQVDGWYLEPEEVTAQADVVVRVVLEAVEPIWWRNKVWTQATCRVTEVWHGRLAESTMQVRAAGGLLDGITTVAGPRPDLRAGEEWVLAVDRMDGSDAWTIIGLTQGAFRVSGDTAVRDYHGFRFVKPPPPHLADGRDLFALATLRRRVGGDAPVPTVSEGDSVSPAAGPEGGRNAGEGAANAPLSGSGAAADRRIARVYAGDPPGAAAPGERLTETMSRPSGPASTPAATPAIGAADASPATQRDSVDKRVFALGILALMGISGAIAFTIYRRNS